MNVKAITFLAVNFIILNSAWGDIDATTGNRTTAVQFRGHLIVPPPCLLNGGEDIEVPFDRVSISRIDGKNFMKEIVYTQSCISPAPWTLSMTITSSTVASFSPGTLQTNIGGLGIKIYIDGKPLEFEKKYTVTAGSPPKLDAVPINQTGVTLAEGKFTAAATMMLKYE